MTERTRIDGLAGLMRKRLVPCTVGGDSAGWYVFVQLPDSLVLSITSTPRERRNMPGFDWEITHEGEHVLAGSWPGGDLEVTADLARALAWGLGNYVTR